MNGFINLLKSPDISSAQAVSRIKRLMGVKVGHAGTLDPEACGVLPIMVGRATKLFDFLLEGGKTYVVELVFGAATDTQDNHGTVTATGHSYPSAQDLDNYLPTLIGTLKQVPSAFSAIKQGGVPLYRLARQGITVEVAARDIEIHSIERIASLSDYRHLLRVSCSKGSYMRALCHDIGEALGCPAHMGVLIREQSGPFDIKNAVCLEDLETEPAALREQPPWWLSPCDVALSHLKAVMIPDAHLKATKNGVPLPLDILYSPLQTGEHVRLYAERQFFGIGLVRQDDLKVVVSMLIDTPPTRS